MYIFSRRIYASNDLFVKIWIVAGILIFAVAAVLMWSNRFRENIETSRARFSPFGVEIQGKENANFTGSRGFFSKMNEMGLPSSVRRIELSELFSNLLPYKYELEPLPQFKKTPILWIYAEGLTKQDRDRCVQTHGKVFFEKEKYCFSIVNKSGFAIQLDPTTFRVLWAQDGGAICALPLLQLPEDHDKKGFSFRIDERGTDGKWKQCGSVPFPATQSASEKIAIPALESHARKSDEFSPESISIESLTLPQECRFFSAPLWDRKAFGELRIRIRENASGKVPPVAWSLDALEVFSSDGTQNYPMTRPDAFNTNVRFLDNEIFEYNTENVLHVPIAKTLFPQQKNGTATSWTLGLRFVRNVFFPEDFVSPAPQRVGKNDSVLPETITVKDGVHAKVRAFCDENYFRQLNKKPAPVVLEIQQQDDQWSWIPYRVKTDTGEELLPESTVNIKPGVRQYWFSSSRTAPKKIEVIYAVTQFYHQKVENVVPTISESR